MPVPLCPAPAQLEALVLGRLTETVADDLERHVSTCQRCGQKLQSLAGEDALLRALRQPLPREDSRRRAAVSAVIAAAKKLRPKLDTATPTLPYDPGSTQEYDPGSTQEFRPEPPTTPAVPNPFPFLRPPQADGEIGRLGPYRVLAVLGAGGMGVVFRAEDAHLRRLVALKVIKAKGDSSPRAREQFLAEARALARLEHDHVVTAYHAGEDNGVPYLAMPLLAGQTLQGRVDEAAGPLPVAEILRVGREIATGLAAAHAHGFVHRDVKPANVWLESRPGAAAGSPPRVKILDFGLAVVAAEDAPAGVAGTPAYMAPEQAAGRVVDGRADLFSLGCVLYVLATGRLPFTGETRTALLISIAVDDPPPVRAANPGLPVALDELIGRLLRKEPADRPDAAAVAAALQGIEDARRPKPSRRAWLAATGAAVLGAAGLTAVGVRKLRPPSGRPADPDPAEVTFEYDEPDARIVVRRDDEEWVVNVGDKLPASLPPGEYALRPAAVAGTRTLWPATVTVAAGEKKTVALRLVGEVAAHREHSLPVGGVAVVTRKGGVFVLSAGQDRTLVAWNPALQDRPTVVWHKDSPLRCVAVSTDGRTVATACGGIGPRAVQAVRFWDVETLEPLGGALAGRSQINAVAFSPTPNCLVSGENDGTLTVWDTRRAAALTRVEKAHDGLGVFAAAFLPGGSRVLTAGGDGTVVVWDVADLKPVRTLVGHAKPVRGLVVLPGGKQAASVGDDATVRVWDLATGQARAWATPTAVRALAGSPDGTRLVTGDDAGMVRLWDVSVGREVVAFRGHAKGVTAVAFTPDGRRAVSGGQDGTVRLWELPQ
ncbi:WD40 repeat domain-containing serine/threonine protein kinase [Limnoglobus roseus]|uniref:Serine/threonine protein kinase n=1 Tax=Limnoglobus roseus TaxID=2598579 RepID=A0A5C1AEX4_9BACT|nr:serine/threonine-protein kinase [Limnoglobus roseus]QEL16262.1 serine/threonine protein kinase [Limnoglobus roseus]